MITIDIKIDKKEIDKIQNRLLETFNSSNKEKLINNINNKVGIFLKSDAEENFISKGGLYKEPWSPLSKSTIEKKKKLGYPLTPLVRTGKLKSGFDYFIEKKSGSVVLYNKAKTKEGYNLATIHNSGATMKRYSSGNRKNTGIKILTRQYLKQKSIKYPKPISRVKSRVQKRDVFREFRFRDPLNGSITTKKIPLKEYSKYSSRMLQEDKLTVSQLSKLTTSGRESKVIKSRDNRYSSYFKKYAAAKKIATSKYGRSSEKSRKALTSYTLPARVMYKIMDYYDNKILSIVNDEILKLVKT